MARGGYDCRGHERNGENMYVFAKYVDCALFAVHAQKALHEAAWPPELLRHYARVGRRGAGETRRGVTRQDGDAQRAGAFYCVHVFHPHTPYSTR